MGTRSLTVIVANTFQPPEEVAVMYRQFDGYLSGHGKELKEFLTGFTVVNGIPVGESGRFVNGGGCLAAQIVAHFKDGPGGVYLKPAGKRDFGEEYTYTVTATPGEPLRIKAECGEAVLFDGTVDEFDPEKIEEEAA